MTGREIKIVLLTALAHAQAHLFILAFSGVTILVAAEFSLNDAGIGRLGNVAPLFFGLGALPAGLLADRIGARWVIIAYLLGASGASVFISFAQSANQVAVGFGLMGAAASLYHPAALSLVTRAVRARGKALGYHGMAGSIAITIAPFVAGLLADSFGSWRACFRILAVPGFLLVPGILFLREEDGADRGNDVEDGQGSSWSILVTLYLLLVILGFSYRGVLTFLPKFLQEEVRGPVLGLLEMSGSDATWGGLLAAIALFAGVPGQWLGGQLSHLFRLERLAVVLALLTAGSLLLMGLLAGGPILGSSILFAFFYFTLQPVGNGLVARYTSPRRRSVAFGISFTLAFGIGSAGSTMTGEVSERWGGLSSGMLANGILMLIGAAVALTLLLLTRKARAAEEPPQLDPS